MRLTDDKDVTNGLVQAPIYVFRHVMKNTRIISILILILIPKVAHTQSFKVNLSPKHSSKLNTIKSGHKRMVKFYKYYKKDSARQARKQEKFYKKQLDSTYRANAKDDRTRRRLVRKGIAMPEKMTMNDSLDTELKKWYAVMKDSTSSDSVKRNAKLKVKELAVAKAKLHPGFQLLQEKYQLSNDSVPWKDVATQIPGFDTLAGVYESSPQELFEAAEKQMTNELAHRIGANKIPSDFGEAGELKNLKAEYEQYTDREKLEAQGKQKATEEAVDYFAENADKLNATQAKVSKLLSKYSDIPNSEDLSTAVKRTSMEGKTFWERLVIGGTFNIVSTEPFSIDLSPQLGYKFTTRLVAGLGMNYRHTFKDSIRHSRYVSPVNTSFRAFVSYDVIKGFFAYMEWERSGTKATTTDQSNREWTNNYFIGIGKKIKIHPMIYFNTMVLYNLNPESKNPTNPSRWQFRFGLQLSELATRKERTTYNPNR